MFFEDYQIAPPDFERVSSQPTTDLFHFVSDRLVAQSNSLKTAADADEKIDIQSSLILSLVASIIMLTAYITEEQSLYDDAKKIMRGTHI